GQVFVLETVGARHDKAVEAAALQFGAQRGDARRAGGALGNIVERLEFRLEHGPAIYGRLWHEATVPLAHARGPDGAQRNPGAACHIVRPLRIIHASRELGALPLPSGERVGVRGRVTLDMSLPPPPPPLSVRPPPPAGRGGHGRLPRTP